MEDNDINNSVSKFYPPVFGFYEHTLTQSQLQLHFYLSGPIEEPEKYIDMIHRIKIAPEGSQIFIYLNTPGGNLSTGVQIVSAMKSTQASVMVIAEAEVYSLGTIILLSADEIMINDHCLLMFHNMSGSIGGKGNEQKLQIDATTKWFSQMAHDIYSGFLTASELKRLGNGEDFWFDSNETRQRIDNMIKFREKKRPKRS